MTQVSAALLFLHKYLQNYSNIYIYIFFFYHILYYQIIKTNILYVELFLDI